MRDDCPFCPGPAHDVPATCWAFPDEANWQVKVCANKFPALRPITSETRGLTVRFQKHQLPGFGLHELVIEGREHLTNPTDLTDEISQQVLLAYRDRLRTIEDQSRLDFVSIFKNVGAEAGASMAHSHSQLIATPFIPNNIRDELNGAESYFAKHQRCVFCELLDTREGPLSRRVAESNQFVVVCPFAPRFAYEMWLLPKAHVSHFETLSESAALEMAQLLKQVLRALDAVAGIPAYNSYLHTSPLRTAPSSSYHWHLEIVPRTARPAGFEWSSGVFINTVLPETAARQLHSAIPQPH